MNYINIYNSLCLKGKDRKIEPGKFYEVHHIIPRSFGGSNHKDNLSTLTLKEHYLAHRLLVAIYPDSKEMHCALWSMCNITPKHCKYKRYSPSSRVYERIRGEYMSIYRGDNHPGKGRAVPQELKDRISKSLKGRKRPDISALMKGKYRGKPLVPREPWYKPVPPELRKNRYKPVLQFTKEGILLKEWEGVIIAAKELGVDYTSIVQCCRKKSASCINSVWIYKEDYTGESIKKKPRSNARTIYQYDENWNLLNKFDSVADTCLTLGLKRGTVSESLRRGYKTSNFYFKYQN